MPMSCLDSILECMLSLKIRLDVESMGSTGFRNPRALGHSIPSVARVLLRAQGFLNLVDPIGRDV